MCPRPVALMNWQRGVKFFGLVIKSEVWMSPTEEASNLTRCVASRTGLSGGGVRSLCLTHRGKDHQPGLGAGPRVSGLRRHAILHGSLSTRHLGGGQET